MEPSLSWGLFPCPPPFIVVFQVQVEYSLIHWFFILFPPLFSIIFVISESPSFLFKGKARPGFQFQNNLAASLLNSSISQLLSDIHRAHSGATQSL